MRASAANVRRQAVQTDADEIRANSPRLYWTMSRSGGWPSPLLESASAAGMTASGSAPRSRMRLSRARTIANKAGIKGSYDYIVVGAGASGSVIAGELSKTGADVLVVESGDR